MKKSGTGRQATDDIQGRMRIASLISKATNIQSEYVTRIVFHGKNNYSNAPQCDIHESVTGLVNILHVSNVCW